MNKLAAMTFTALAAFTTGAAHADGLISEWRVLGPAFSHHFTMDGAAITRPSSSKTECADKFANAPAPKPFTSATPIPGAIGIGRTGNGDYIYMPMPAPSATECVTVVAPAERGWHSNNPALGLELTQRYDDHSNKFLVNYVRESYGSQSLMLAAGRFWPLLDVYGVQVDGGVVGGLWYRTVLNQVGDGLVRRVIPFALPSLAITESVTGLGLDIGFAPKLSVHGYKANRTPTLMFQTTYLVKDSRRGWTAFRLGTTGGNDIKASMDVTF